MQELDLLISLFKPNFAVKSSSFVTLYVVLSLIHQLLKSPKNLSVGGSFESTKSWLNLSLSITSHQEKFQTHPKPLMVNDE